MKRCKHVWKMIGRKTGRSGELTDSIICVCGNCNKVSYRKINGVGRVEMRSVGTLVQPAEKISPEEKDYKPCTNSFLACHERDYVCLKDNGKNCPRMNK